MSNVVHAHVNALPIEYPRAIVLEYRIIDLDTDHETGEVVTEEPRRWREIRHAFKLNAYETVELASLLIKGKPAYMGVWKVGMNQARNV